MKIGILTFHSQLNYGGVLQCWALQTALRELGQEVVVIDRRLEAGERSFSGIAAKLTFCAWIRILIRGLLGCGDFSWLKRCSQTACFIKERLNITQYSFYDWRYAPRNLGVDVVVVGSDQVWHCGEWGNPLPYLLENAPSVRAIAYAASFGMEKLPKHVFNDFAGQGNNDAVVVYKKGLSRFERISCRESAGVEICKSLGYEATHVVDPTLLAFYGRRCIAKQRVNTERPTLVCYFMGVDVFSVIDELESFACEKGCKVVVFTDSPLTPICKSLCRFLDNLRRSYRGLISIVQIRTAAGPAEFFETIVNAQWTITDSFHALMFSIIGHAEVRILRPYSAFRRKIFSRISEFADHARGKLVVPSVGAALKSFAHGESVVFDEEWLRNRVERSRNWLKEAIR